MKVKRKCRTIIAIVAVLCVLTAGLTCNAVGNTRLVEPRFTAISKVQAELSITSSGKTTCNGAVELRNGYTAELTMKLQRSTNGVIWTDVKTWTTSGNGTLSLEYSYYVASGYWYRVESAVDTYNAAGAFIESASAYSNICRY